MNIPDAGKTGDVVTVTVASAGHADVTQKITLT